MYGLCGYSPGRGSLKGDVIQQWGNRKRVFLAFGRYVFSTLGNEADIII